MINTNSWENIKCSKPPTRLKSGFYLSIVMLAYWGYSLNKVGAVWTPRYLHLPTASRQKIASGNYLHKYDSNHHVQWENLQNIDWTIFTFPNCACHSQRLSHHLNHLKATWRLQVLYKYYKSEAIYFGGRSTNWSNWAIIKHDIRTWSFTKAHLQRLKLHRNLSWRWLVDVNSHFQWDGQTSGVAVSSALWPAGKSLKSLALGGFNR